MKVVFFGLAHFPLHHRDLCPRVCGAFDQCHPRVVLWCELCDRPCRTADQEHAFFWLCVVVRVQFHRVVVGGGTDGCLDSVEC